MSVQDPARLRALLGTDEWRWWRERSRASLEAGRLLPAVMTLQQPSPAQMLAANRLFARPGQQGPLRVDHAQLLALLVEAGIADDLEACLEALDGPMRNLRDELERDAQAWRRLGATAASRLANLDPQAAQRLQLILDSGWLRRLCVQDLAFAAQLMEHAVEVLTILRQRRETSLAILAARATGDAHALDRDRPLGRLVLRLAGEATDEAGILGWRAGWTRMDVETDPVSASVLVLNLRARGTGAAARLLNAAADAGEPLRMTARLMQQNRDCELVVDGLVLVCENPSVVAAAATRLAARCRTLICLDGQPSTPGLMLLAKLRQAEIPCGYHGDFDWPGIAIARDLHRRFEVTPWRFTSADLLLAGPLPGPLLEGTAQETPWDPPLRAVLEERGRALHEEAVIEDLLKDLDNG